MTAHRARASTDRSYLENCLWLKHDRKSIFLAQTELLCRLRVEYILGERMIDRQARIALDKLLGFFALATGACDQLLHIDVEGIRQVLVIVVVIIIGACIRIVYRSLFGSLRLLELTSKLIDDGFEFLLACSTW